LVLEHKPKIAIGLEARTFCLCSSDKIRGWVHWVVVNTKDKT